MMIKQLPANLFARMLDESPDAAAIIDQHGTLCYLNAASQTLTGFAPGEALGRPLDALLPEGVAEKHRAYLLGYISKGTVSSVLGQVRQFAVRHRTGEMIPILLKAFDLGVHDGIRYFGALMVDMRARRAQQAKTAAQMARLEQQAMSDPLTMLPNLRAFDAELAQVAARASRNSALTSVGVADIDFFKQVNDQYGHPVGDLVLCAVGKAIELAARGTDFVARTGGEEFGMLFPATSIELAAVVAERIRQAVAASNITTPDGECIRVTMSVGLAALAPGAAPQEALSRADAALYQAKENGRNQVATAG